MAARRRLAVPGRPDLRERLTGWEARRSGEAGGGVVLSAFASNGTNWARGSTFLGVRWHEWHLGLGILVALLGGIGLGVVHDALPSFLALAAGVWLIAKDWRDLFARYRDTGGMAAPGCTAGRTHCAGSGAPSRCPSSWQARSRSSRS